MNERKKLIWAIFQSEQKVPNAPLLRKDFLDNFVAVEMADKQVAAYPLFNEDDYY